MFKVLLDFTEQKFEYIQKQKIFVIGVGGIGCEAARLCKAFGMYVIGVDPRRKKLGHGIAEIYTPEHLDNLLPKADFVIMTIPHTPETEGLINRKRLQLMKQTGFLINIGRGMTVKLDDLVISLETGEIAGAALDVFEIEPLPAEHALWTAPNTLITPHTAGFGPYLDDRRLEILLENCDRFGKGLTLKNIVDKRTWF